MRCLKSYITEAQIGFTFSGKNNQSKLRSAAESSCLACCEPACVLTHQFVWFVAVWSGVGGRSVNGEAEGAGGAPRESPTCLSTWKKQHGWPFPLRQLDPKGENQNKDGLLCEKRHPLSAPVQTAEPKFNEKLKKQTQFKSSNCQHQQRSELSCFFLFQLRLLEWKKQHS